MRKGLFIWLLLAICLGGCASSSELRRQASVHEQRAAQYMKIGKPDDAQWERKEAIKDRKRAKTVVPTILEIYERIFRDSRREK